MLEEANAQRYCSQAPSVRQPQQSESDDETGYLQSGDGFRIQEKNALGEYHELLSESSNNLDHLAYDVWFESVLPCLDVRSIFRLCGVSRKLRKLLLTEQTFKAICVVSNGERGGGGGGGR